MRSKSNSSTPSTIPAIETVIKNGNIYIFDPNGLPGELIVADPAEPEDLVDPTVLNLDED